MLQMNITSSSCVSRGREHLVSPQNQVHGERLCIVSFSVRLHLLGQSLCVMQPHLPYMPFILRPRFGNGMIYCSL